MRNRLKAIEKTVKDNSQGNCNHIIIYNKDEVIPKPHKDCKVVIFLPNNRR